MEDNGDETSNTSRTLDSFWMEDNDDERSPERTSRLVLDGGEQWWSIRKRTTATEDEPSDGRIVMRRGARRAMQRATDVGGQRQNVQTET